MFKSKMKVIYIGAPVPDYSAHPIPYGSIHIIEEVKSSGDLQIIVKDRGNYFLQTYSRIEFIPADLTKLERLIYGF